MTWFDHFQPARWKRPGLRSLASTGEVFQAIVSDLVSHEIPSSKTFPGLGNDGGIDIWIESAPQGSLFDGLDFPLIVELRCQEDPKDARAAVKKSWHEKRESIRKKAQSGWEGIAAPWKDARSWVLIVSSTIPTADADKDIGESMRKFFSTDLPKIDGLAPRKSRVIDWSKLAPRLNANWHLRDRWIAHTTPNVRTHDELLAQLTASGPESFRRLLAPSEWSFVPPDENSPYAPAAIYSELLSGAPGLLIFGHGGVGKTRTALEVAQLANDDRDSDGRPVWRVLHAIGDITLEELKREITPGGAPRVLVVFDYVEQVRKLDLHQLRDALILPLAAAGVSISLLATSRTHTTLDGHFRPIPLQLTPEHAARLARAAYSRLAPGALELLSEERMDELCGRRPILAMFIAREIESQLTQPGGPAILPLAAAGRSSVERQADSPVFPLLQEGSELVLWLRKRLRRDGLIPHEDDRAAEPFAIACAAVAAMAPDVRESLDRVAAQVLGEDDAPTVVDVLRRMGWLEGANGAELSAAHDVIADELLREVVSAPPDQIRRAELRRVLAACLVAPRSFGRLAVTLNRLASGGGDDFKPPFVEETSAWLLNNLAPVQTMLVNADPDEAAYALAAAISLDPWSPVVVANWSELVTPFLRKFGSRREARHIIYRGMRLLGKTPTPQSAELTAAAVEWLRANSGDATASFVLPYALQHTTGDLQRSVVGVARQWLVLHAARFEAHHVLRALFQLPGLEPQWHEAFAQETARWIGIAGHVRTVAAVRLVEAAIGGGGAAARPAVREMLTRLTEKLGRQPVSRPELADRYLIELLLSASETLGIDSGAAAALAAEWVLAHVTHPAAVDFVYGLLRNRRTASRMFDAAGVWLRANGHLPEAHAVAGLRIAALPRDDARVGETIRAALEWIALPEHDSPRSAHVLSAVLARTEPALDSEALVNATKTYLGRHEATLEAGHLYAAAFWSRVIRPLRRQLIPQVLSWLRMYQHEELAELVMRQIMQNNTLESRDRSRFARIGMDMVRQRPSDADARYLLKWLIAYGGVDQSDEREVLARGLAWARQFRDHDEADYVRNPLLMRDDLPDGEWRELAQDQLAWMARRNEQENVSWALVAVASRDDVMSDEEREQLVDIMRTYIEHYGPQFAGVHVSRIEEARILLETFTAGREPADARAAELFTFIRMAAAGASAEELELAGSNIDWTPVHRTAFLYIARSLESEGQWHAMTAARPLLERLSLEHGQLNKRRLEMMLKSGSPSALNVRPYVELFSKSAQRDEVPDWLTYIAPLLLALTAATGDAALQAEACAHVAATRARMDENALQGLEEHARTTIRAWHSAAQTRELLLAASICSPAAYLEAFRDTGEAAGFREFADFALDRAAARMRSGRALSAARWILPLLPLAMSADDPELAARVLADIRETVMPALNEGVRMHIAQDTVYTDDYLAAWPDQALAESTLIAIGLGPPLELILNRAALEPDRPVDPQLVRSALDYSAELVRHGSQSRAGWILAPLVPLTSRTGDETLVAELEEMIGRITAETSTLRIQQGLGGAVWKLYDQGAWPDRTAADNLLQRLQIAAPRAYRLLMSKDEPVSRQEVLAWLDEAEAASQAGRVHYAHHLLVPAMPLAARCGDETVLEKAMAAVDRFLESPLVPHEAAEKFRETIGTLGWWVDRQLGEDVLERLGVSVARLDRIALLPDPPRADVERALGHAERLLISRPRGAGKLLMRILPLACRAGFDDALQRALSLSCHLLSSADMPQRFRDYLVRTMKNKWVQHPWPNPAAAWVDYAAIASILRQADPAITLPIARTPLRPPPAAAEVEGMSGEE